jgi:CRISPR-associated protein Csb2
MVLRERCPREEGRSRWYRSLVDAITGAGAAVVEAHKLHTSDVSRYVHRIRSEMAVQPYRAILRLGPLAGSGTILAIGQSRHLGGGLLVPVDVPAGSGCPAAGGEERP